MFALDMTEGWEPVPGLKGIFIKPLSGELDESSQKGFRTRCVRVEPGGETFEPFSHDYWEEVFILEGELTAKADGSTVTAPAYVLRPPHTPHGPLISETGCTLLEVQYFAERAIGMRAHLDPQAPESAA
ncbi:cupin domain-containing protein [Pseudohoeflea coraliihabitans]|uniref:Cupin domain-containing protein n=1 Tax=Pseudohoeflea coraliihabitans TaxID=2860393 RepID=A0ABS6WQI0_9HYPH|nr:cupin domain-containing protein [Pseudohoeflea sp. DP4N28-3]MBW3098170.1 cupin domain-containing protein [Pseudohoeflea sp. DP4N28-3]